jgi:hypothetical protein
MAVGAGPSRNLPAIPLGGRDGRGADLHHGYKGLNAELRAAEAPPGSLWENVRADLVARLAANRYLCFKDADLAQWAAMLEVWRRRRGQMISQPEPRQDIRAASD